jgi:uncharacterized membrane protein
MLKNFSKAFDKSGFGVWHFLIVTILILGIFFRFTNLGQKIYWIDETFTSLRVSGYTEEEVVNQVSNAPLSSIEFIEKYQHPNAERGLMSTINSLEIEDPHHPPLYYVLARFWSELFGGSVAVMRSLPAIFSLLALPCIYWLSLELFNSSLTGWIAVLLLAISPFQLLYAHEAREYSLWTVTILISNLAFLRAMRINTKASWIIYAVSITISLYTFLFTALVGVGHGIYVVIIEKFRFTKKLLAYIFSSLLAIILFLPWVVILINNWSHFEKAQDWITKGKSSLIYLFLTLVENISLIFFDNSSVLDPLIYKDFFRLSNLFLLGLFIYSFYLLYRKTPIKVWLFIFILTFFTALFLLIPDLLFGGLRTAVPRYKIPTYLGVDLAVAYLLSNRLTSIANQWQHKLWQLIIVILISGGVLSCVTSSQAEYTWNKSLSKDLPEVTDFLNKAPSPLLIGSPTAADLLALSYRANPKLKLLVIPQSFTVALNSPADKQLELPKLPEGFSDVFLWKAGSYKKWLDAFEKEQKYQLKPIFSQEGKILLWKIEKSQ